MYKQPGHKAILANESEIAYIRRNQTYTQRFDLLMKLMRINRMLKSAKITKP